MTQFSQHEVEMIVDRAVNKTLASLGLDLSDPKGVRYAQADFQFLSADTTCRKSKGQGQSRHASG